MLLLSLEPVDVDVEPVPLLRHDLLLGKQVLDTRLQLPRLLNEIHLVILLGFKLGQL